MCQSHASKLQGSRNLTSNFPSASCRHSVGWGDVYSFPSILAMEKVGEATNCAEGCIILY